MSFGACPSGGHLVEVMHMYICIYMCMHMHIYDPVGWGHLGGSDAIATSHARKARCCSDALRDERERWARSRSSCIMYVYMYYVDVDVDVYVYVYVDGSAGQDRGVPAPHESTRPW